MGKHRNFIIGIMGRKVQVTGDWKTGGKKSSNEKENKSKQSGALKRKPKKLCGHDKQRGGRRTPARRGIHPMVGGT